jgi:hypothetical protein
LLLGSRCYNEGVETSYTPPEVISQYSGDSGDQQPDEQDDQKQAGSNQNSPFADPSGAGASSDPSSPPPGLSGQDPLAGGEGGKAGAGQTLTFKEQLKMLSPLGLLQAMIGQAPSEEEKKRQQEHEARQEQMVYQSQAQWQAHQQLEEQKKQALQQQLLQIKSQAGALKHVESSSVLTSPTVTNASLADIQLAEQALRDAQKEEMRHKQQGMNVPKGKQTGPVDAATLAKQQSGAQKMSEMTMGE